MKPVRSAAAELRVRPAIVLAAWSLYGFVSLLQWGFSRPEGAPSPWKPYGPAIYWMTGAWVWAALTPLIVLVVRRLRAPLPLPLIVAGHAAAIAAVHAVMTLIDGYTFYFITRRLPERFLEGYPRGVLHSALLYAATALAAVALDQVRLARARAARAAQLESDLAHARLETLRRQLQPHFLFNTLNTIAGLIDTHPSRAGEMIARLGELLRRSLDEHEAPLIPLAEELTFARAYTDIERVRFESWLTVAEEIDPAVLSAPVPPMVLQPLIENAIRHGISPSRRHGTIRLRAVRSDGDRLILQVIDNGVGLQNAAQSGRPGIGLRTTRERLRHLFGAEALLGISSGDAGTCVTLELPLLQPAGRRSDRSA